MKYIFFFIALLFFNRGSAQDRTAYKRDSAFISKIPVWEVRLASDIDTSGSRLAMPFQRFVLRDVRPDTSVVGIVISKKLGGTNSFVRLNFRKGTSLTLDEYFNKKPFFSFTEDGSSLLCFIKQLHLTEEESIDKAHKRVTVNRLRFQVECYLQKQNSFFPAIRVDTILTSVSGVDRAYECLQSAVELLAAKASALNIQSCLKRKEYTSAELDTRYQKIFDLPILTQNQHSKGVYRSFEEFTANKPSLAEYELVTDRIATLLFTKDSTGQWVPERKAYAVSDGSTLWLNADALLTPIIRRGNTFEYVSWRNGDRLAYLSPIPGNPLPKLRADLLSRASAAIMGYQKLVTIHQLDMETGKF